MEELFLLRKRAEQWLCQRELGFYAALGEKANESGVELATPTGRERRIISN